MADRPRNDVLLVLIVVASFGTLPRALAMSLATDGFSVMMRDLDMRGWNRTQLWRFCKRERNSRGLAKIVAFGSPWFMPV